jgi:NAD(P)-dependent dehydrogenase (short-subunit alcohol dehydrogenase family)
MNEQSKTVVITGASSGFGESAARAFADKGYRVWAAMRDIEGRNAGKRAALESHSGNVSVIEIDVTSDDSVTAGFAAILRDGPVDVLINNAGVMYLGITEAFSVAQAHEQMNTNYYGVIRATQAVLPSMRAAGAGLIINCSSAVGRISPPFFGTYTATKHALEGYSQCLRYELAPFGIDVAIVEPGPFGTGLLASGRPPEHNDVLTAYGDLAAVPDAIGEQFTQMLASDDAPDPQWVVDAYLGLADMASGERPVRTLVGISWGVDELNRLTQSIQDQLLKEFKLDGLLGGGVA